MNKLNFGLIFIVVIVLSVLALIFLPHFSRHVDKITVSEKTVKRYGSGDTSQEKYLVFTTAGNVFENTDSLLEWKFDSSNIYAKLIPGNTYIVNSYGWRVPFISSYKNILDVKLINEKQAIKQKKTDIKQADLIGGPQKEEFVDIDGKRAFFKIDGLPVDTYVKERGLNLDSAVDRSQ